ncbi:uncharacterized protein TNCV_164721 [Trichonephila clavipes]|nr:uncharacterized protein TNCV_164721 [Trichonephila clavipes]
MPQKNSNVVSIENATTIKRWPEDFYNDTQSNVSHPQDMHGFGKKVVGKIKVGIKSIKNKIKNFKIKGGGGGGTSGRGGGGYHRPYIHGLGGSFGNNPNNKWILIGLGVTIALIFGFVTLYLIAKHASKVPKEDLKETRL